MISRMYSMYVYNCVHILWAAHNDKGLPANNYASWHQTSEVPFRNLLNVLFVYRSIDINWACYVMLRLHMPTD